MKNKQLSLGHLAWPIAVEMLLQFMMGMIDSLMVSRLGDHQVSAVSVSNQMINSIMTVFFLINAGAGIVVSRKWGAGIEPEVHKTAAMAIKINLYAGLLLSTGLALFASPLLSAMNTPEEVLPHGAAYLSIVGGGMVVTVLHMTLTTVIRGTGNTKGTMYISLGMNVVHLVLNYLLIFGHYGFPELGLTGAALSTLISKCIALLLCVVILLKTFHTGFTRQVWRGYDRPLMREMLSIGLPSIFTSMSWGVSQLFVISVVSSLGALPLAAYTYISLIQQLPFTIGTAFGGAAQIQAGQQFGAKDYDMAYRSPYKGAFAGMVFSAVAACAAWWYAEPLLQLFTGDQGVIQAALPIFTLCLIWQPMRVWTFTITAGLNAVGEAGFVAVISVLGMWLTTTGGAYVFGLWAGWGIVGVFAAFMLDEAFRAVYAWIRWRQRRCLPPAVRAQSPTQTQVQITS